MNKTRLEIAVGGQKAEAFLYRKEGGPRPGVLLLTDIRGVTDVYHARAERIAAAGYTVLLPNVFYRAGELPMFPFPFTPGEERTVKRMQELFAALNPEMQLADCATYLDFLADRGEGGLGVVGYCFTGGMALRAAAVRPNLVRAAASFHGARLYTLEEDSPHHLLPRVKAALYFGHATNDALMPAGDIVKLENALRTWGGKFVSETYEGAQHGWTNSASPIYNEKQAERAFEKLIALLRANLP